MLAAARLDPVDDGIQTASSGRLELSVTLAAHSVCLIEVTPA